MRVKARKHVRNEGFRRFRSTPLRHRVSISGVDSLNMQKLPRCAGNAPPVKATLWSPGTLYLEAASKRAACR
jgi:hypothetical protein